MTDPVEKLVALGAYSCGGALLWKNKELGKFRNGVFDVSEEGLALLQQDITDVVVKQDVAKVEAKAEAPAPRARKVKAPKAEAPVAAPAAPVEAAPAGDDLLDGLDDLIKGE